MELEKELDALRAALPECRVAAFVDLKARLVLVSSASEKPRQEWLDALAATGANVLPVSDDALEQVMPGAGLPDQATLMRADGVCVYVRLPDEPAEALCCDCRPGADSHIVADQARDALARIASAG